MCTVSFAFHDGIAIITSNRDEKVQRPSALVPKSYKINGKNVFFPKDNKAGGTWFAIREDGSIIVLLNGGASNHVSKVNYRKSRGLIVLDLISSSSIIESWNEIDLENIEPFTLVFYEKLSLKQLQWNGVLKSATELNINHKYIWSSATLYAPEVIAKRKLLFEDYVNSKEVLTSDDLYKFHHNYNPNDIENGFVMNRNDILKTLSITQAIVNQNRVNISYTDLQLNKRTKKSFITI